jgi:glycosyltransferase involved in cell wall biosynthesis
MKRPIPILHPITRLIIGGAQENTMLTADLLDKRQWAAAIIAGPQTGPEGSLIEEVRARGIPLTLEPALVRELNPLKDLQAFFRLFKFIKQGRFTIVHTHSSKAGIVGRWAARAAGAPVIVHTVHGWGHHERQHPLVQAVYIFLEKLTLLITDQLIVVSPQDIQKGLMAGIGRPENYVIIRSGIELDRFGCAQLPPTTIRTQLGIPGQALVVGTVTRLSPQKSPLDFIEAAAMVAQQIPEAWFVVVGDGSLRPKVEARAAELGLTDRLVLTGLRRDVPELMAAFDVFALSSLWEGLPRVLPQAMATGLPIVATAVDGNCEAVKDGVTGRLVPPGQPAALAQAVVDLLRDPQLAYRLGQAGRNRVAEFSATQMVEQISDLYIRLIQKKRILSRAGLLQ